MKTGGYGDSAQGFTIVETLIVLAVTSVLFFSAALLINGKQNRTDFQIGSRAIQQQFQQVINETQSGFYPGNGDFTCQAKPGGLTFSNASNTQGANGDCIFAGKTVTLNPAASTNRKYNVYSLAGRRVDSAGKDVKTPVDASLKSIPNAAQTAQIPNGLEYYGNRPEGSAATPWAHTDPYAMAFVSSMANFASTQDGTQRLELHGYKQWVSTDTDEDNINMEINVAGAYPLLPGVDLCFNSGGTDQSVIVTISQGLRVSSAIKTGKNCP